MQKKQLFLIGSLTFMILIILSVVFYKERTCFMDISFHLFHILKSGNFEIQSYRFSAFFTQMFPIIGSKMGAPLTTITIAYSMSFVLLPFLSFTIILFILKNMRVAAMYLIYLLLMTTDTFYWIQSEMPQGVAFLFILIGMLDNMASQNVKYSFVHWLIISILIATVCFAHPLLSIPFAFLILFYFITYPRKYLIILSIAGLYLLFYMIHSKYFVIPYDVKAIEQLTNFETLYPHYFTIQSSKNLYGYFLHDYYLAVIMLLVNIVFYVREKQFLKPLFMLVFFIGYSLIINVCFPDGSPQFYLENQYLLLSIFVVIPFVIDILPRLKSIKTQYTLISAICLIGIIRIFANHGIYTERLQWNQHILSSTATSPHKKLVVPYNLAPNEILLMKWASAYEFWLLSTLETGTSRSVVVEDHQDEFNWLFPSKKALITKWGAVDYSDLSNKKYFNFTDTSGYVKYSEVK